MRKKRRVKFTWEKCNSQPVCHLTTALINTTHQLHVTGKSCPHKGSVCHIILDPVQPHNQNISFSSKNIAYDTGPITGN